MRTARIVCPKTAKRGDIIEIKTLINHPMETGYRRDDMGQAIVRDIFKTFVVTYNGTEIFRSDLFPGVAANPYFAFTTIATESGTLEFTWTDEKGIAHVEKAQITVD
jgi:sulfur-oxidizing protein SoxZ